MQGFCAYEIMLRAKHGGRVSAIALLLSCQMERSRKDPRQLAGGYQERRRAAALDKQRNARKEAANRARRLAIAAAESEGSSERASEVRDQGCAELCMTHRQCFRLGCLNAAVLALPVVARATARAHSCSRGPRRLPALLHFASLQCLPWLPSRPSNNRYPPAYQSRMPTSRT